MASPDYTAVWQTLSNALWLEQNRPALAAAITSLPWVADGIEDAERQAVQELVDTEVVHGEDSAPALVNRPWVMDGLDELETRVIAQVRLLTASGEAEGRRVVRMPFLQTIELVDADALAILAALGEKGRPRSLFHAVLERPWTEDGFNEHEVELLRILEDISNSAEEVAVLIVAMPFLETVEPADIDTVYVLAGLASASRELFDAAVKKPWVADGLSESDVMAIRTLERLADMATALQVLEAITTFDPVAVAILAGLADRELGLFQGLADRPWINDGLDAAEIALLAELESLSDPDEAAKQWLTTLVPSGSATESSAESPLNSHDANDNGSIELDEVISAIVAYSNAKLENDRLIEVIAHYAFAESLVPAPSLVDLLESTSWYQDGIDEDPIYLTEWRADRVLRRIFDNSPELADRVSRWAWVFDEPLIEGEVSVLEYLSDLDGQEPDAVQPIIDLPWLTDGVDRWESSAISALWGLAMDGNLGYAALAEAPWVVDGVTPLEVVLGIRSLSAISGQHEHGFFDVRDGRQWTISDLPHGPELAQQIMSLVDYPPKDIDLYLVFALNIIRQSYPDGFRRLLAEPWFVDGLDEEERIYLIVSSGASEDVANLFEPHAIETKAIELPLAGIVNLWAIRHGPFHPEQNILVKMEEAVRGSEAFWSLPFPMEHVILYLDDGMRGVHIGHMMFLGTGGILPYSSVYHEVAHYYFQEGPRWFTEGGAEIVRLYIENNGNIPRIESSTYCAEQGLKNLQDWTNLRSGDLWDGCSYSMGLHFLATLRKTMGEEAWLSSLRAYYLAFGREHEGLYLTPEDAPMDDDIYRVFLAHTPPELIEEVKNVFRQLHGGPFVAPAT